MSVTSGASYLGSALDPAPERAPSLRLALLLGGVGLALLAATGTAGLTGQRVAAQVAEARVEADADGPVSQVRYAYEVAGRSYSGSARLAGEVTPGEALQVVVSADDPARSRPARGWTGAAVLWVAALLGLASALAWGRRPER